VLKLRVEKGRSWRHRPYWLELYDADGRYVGIVWSRRATLRKSKWGEYSLREDSGFFSDVVLWVIPVVAD